MILMLLMILAIAAFVMKAFSDQSVLARQVSGLVERVQLLEARFAGDSAQVVLPAATPVQAPAATRASMPAWDRPAPATLPAAPPPRPAPALGIDWERLLTEHWMVWLGGIALALGGAFLVKLSVDYGLLTPPIRVVLGSMLGIGILVLGEWVFRHGRPETGESVKPSTIPQSLIAAGLATLFADVYAAYQLYALIPSGVAFPLLAMIAAGGVIMSLRHGQFVAALGLLGSFVAPLLVHTTTPHALPLFMYIAVISAGSLLLLRLRPWRWLAWCSFAGSIFWALLWLGSSYTPADTVIVGGFLIVLLGLYLAFRQGVAILPFMADPIDDPMVLRLVRIVCWVTSLVMVILVNQDGFTDWSLAAAALMVGAILWSAYRDQALDDVMGAAAALVLAILATWGLALPEGRIDALLAPVPASDTTRFIAVALAAAALFGSVGFGVLRRAARPGMWATLASAGPIAILAMGFWRLESFGLAISWGVAGLTLAAINLFAAQQAAQYRAGDARFEGALAAFAVGVLASIVLAAAMTLKEAWLTVALVLNLPILGWVEGRIRLPILRDLAVGLATVVLVRLAVNPEIAHYRFADRLVFNWPLYGYGIPAIAFFVARRQFASRSLDLLVELLEAGCIIFAFLLITFELRHAIGHTGIDLALQDLLRDSMQSLAWLVMAMALLRIGLDRKRRVLVWGGIGLFCLATAQAVIWQAFMANPAIADVSVGSWLLFDSLLIAYGLPALIYGAIAIRRLGPSPIWLASRGLALCFALLWLTLEVRHDFRGEYLARGDGGQAEWYAYSVAWLIFAAICLGVGLYRRSIWLRRTALAGIGLVVAKVFLSDVFDLGGVWRALSCLGLGAVLVAIGYCYPRLTAVPKPR